MSQNTSIAPTAAKNRIALLDIYRGFALLGIFIVNLRFMTSAVLHPAEFQWMNDGTLNKITWFILENFFNGKFFPIFSFLFGVGFAMQMNNMEDNSKFSAAFFARRYFYLMFFGFMHLFFLWGGDILIAYAMAGYIILLIRKIPPKYVLVISILIILFPLYGHLKRFVYDLLRAWDYGYLIEIKDYNYNEIVNIILNGSYIENLRFRLYEYSVYYHNIELLPTLIAMILIGYYAGRKRFYIRIPEIAEKFKTYFPALVVYILAVRISHYYLKEILLENYKLYIIFTKLVRFANIAQSFIYLWLIAVSFKTEIGRNILFPLAFAGRMSLTNYLMQSVIGFILFNGFFLGLYGQFNLYQLFIIAVIAYITLILGSKAWFKKFNWGPFEWIWRDLTYKTSLKLIKNKQL